MNNSSQWVGIDISKATLDVYIRPLGKAIRLSNTAEDISKLVQELKSTSLNLIVLEATGGLETELVSQLQASGLPVSLINPRQGRDFAKATGKFAKTDAIDAKILAHFGEAMKPQVLAAESEDSRQLRDLISRRRQLVEMRTAEKNRRDRARGKALADIEAHIDYLDQRLDELNREIEQLTQTDPQWLEKVIKVFYERLVERGKAKKLALTACVRKILVILNAMVRSHQPWQLKKDLQPVCP